MPSSQLFSSDCKLQGTLLNLRRVVAWQEAQYRKRFRQTANVNKFVSRDKAFALLDVHCSLLLLICLQSNATLTNKNRLIQFLSTYFSIFRN